MINIGLLGLGTVGTGVMEMLRDRQNELTALTGKEIKVKKILVKNIDKKRSLDLEQEVLTLDINELVNDKDISILVEVTGDLEQSYDYIKAGLNSGKHIVTANKAVVSKYFEELSALAEKNALAFLYEASVAGGIPVLKPLKETIALNEITEVMGILNGTCNYILTRMFKEKLDYKDVLKQAQDLGYAEANPAADVEGHDTLRKLRILGTLALQGEINEEDIYLNGISNITALDIFNIESMKKTLKLVGSVKSMDNGFIATVQPTIFSQDSLFSSVNMVHNSVIFKGDNVGELMFYGQGAGKLPTANAVLSDLVDIVMNSYRPNSPLGDRILKNLNHNIRDKYYLRLPASVDMDLLNKITDNILSTNEAFAIVTKEVALKDLLDLIKSLSINADDFFLAKIYD